MIVRQISGINDWQFGNSLGNYLQANPAVAQNINTRLGSFLGNCFFDLTAGVNWYGLLGFKDQLALNIAVSTCILNTPEVTGILQISSGLNANRDFTVQYQVQTIYSSASSSFTFNSSIG